MALSDEPDDRPLEAGSSAEPIPDVFGDGTEAPGGEEPVGLEEGAVSVPSLEAIIVEPEPLEALEAASRGEDQQQAVEGYVDMGETWGYDQDGKLRTVRDEGGEMPPAPEASEKKPVERPAARKRHRAEKRESGRQRTPRTPRAPRSSRKH
ncbi:MAG TPA: hypothetical protein VHF22_08950 [Planctomycetota bacterium]|nr:hypothetical protein [Planctomycetota bacterium]